MDKLNNLSKEEYKELRLKFGYKVARNISWALHILNYCKIKHNGN